MNHHRPATKRGGGGGGGGDPTTILQPGQVNFRLLCHVNTAGGVIGNSGSRIKQLETQTGCKIRFEEPLPNCHERVINVIGDSNVDRKIVINHEIGEEVEISRAQEGLIRVFERVLQVERNAGGEGGAVGCRLLAISGQIGALMGKRGKIVDGIRRSTGAKIKVLKKEQLPACAVPEEELIQIMGGILAVKKALVPVSRRLQGCLSAERTTTHVTPEEAFHEQSADSLLDTKSSITPLSRNAVNHSPAFHLLSSDIDRVLNLDEDTAQRKVVFRLLCSNVAAGGVIGRGASIVKSLEKDTGASIKFSTPIAGSKERVATISSLEGREPLYSPAQVATVRVFERSIEVSHEHGHSPRLGNGDSILARILVAPHEINFLLDERGRVLSGMGSATGVEVQLLGADHASNCAAENDKVVQISGEHDNVKSALFQLIGRLRENFFSSSVSEGAVPRNSSHASSGFHEVGTDMPSQLDHFPSLSSLDQMDHLGFVPNLGGPQALLKDKQSKDRFNGKPKEDRLGGRNSSVGGREQGRVDNNRVAKRTIAITVSGQKFGSVYGENGSNLARLKEISGAAVVIQDPHPGERDGKVIVSGKPEQIQIAQSLLQAFILM